MQWSCLKYFPLILLKCCNWKQLFEMPVHTSLIMSWPICFQWKGSICLQLPILWKTGLSRNRLELKPESISFRGILSSQLTLIIIEMFISHLSLSSHVNSFRGKDLFVTVWIVPIWINQNLLACLCSNCECWQLPWCRKHTAHEERRPSRAAHHTPTGHSKLA